MKDAYIGIDFGGTNIRFITYDQENDSFSNYKKNTVTKFDTVEEEVIYNLVIPLEEIIEEQVSQGYTIQGIGIALAAMFDRDTGAIVEWSNNSKYQGFLLKDYIEHRFHVKVYMEDDANAATVGEHWKGEGKNSSNFAYITVSTGIGCGIIVQDTLLRGSHGWAGELGHIQVTKNPDCICTCGRVGCLQSISSGTAISKRYKKLLSRNSKQQEEKEKFTNDTNHKLLMDSYSINLEERIFDAKEIAQLAHEGNELAIQVLREAGESIGVTIANVTMLLDIPIYVLGGGVIEIGDSFLEYIQHGIYEVLQDRREIELRISKLNDRNGMIGVIKWML